MHIDQVSGSMQSIAQVWIQILIRETSIDGQQVLVAVGDRVFIYNAITGEVIDSKRAHKDVVYALAYSKDGQRWASGGADNSVVVWSAEGVGLLKYAHNAKVQCLCFNPVL